jgi:hypothetical protein
MEVIIGNKVGEGALRKPYPKHPQTSDYGVRKSSGRLKEEQQ